MSAIKVFETNSKEYGLLTTCAHLLTKMSPTHKIYRVGVTYFDYGQNWKWTTVLAEDDKWGGYQALNPAEQERLFECKNVADVLEVATSVLNGKYCPDRIRA